MQQTASHTQPQMDFTVSPGGVMSGKFSVPGDKSISHRALLMGAIAEGETRISGFLAGADCLATLAAIRALGIQVDTPTPDRVSVHGKGLMGLHEPKTELDLGNSGTAMRILLGLLAGQEFAARLTGDESLRKRPMQRVIAPLSEIGRAHV